MEKFKNSIDYNFSGKTDDDITFVEYKNSRILIIFYILMMLVIASIISIFIMAILSNKYGIKLSDTEAINSHPYFNNDLETWTNFITYFIGFVFSIILMRYSIKKDITKLKTMNIGAFFALIGIGIALMIIAAIIGNIITIIFNVTEEAGNEESINNMLDTTPLNLTLTCISTIILGPIFEELVFRKSLFNLFSKNSSIITTIVLSSLLFGLIHILGPVINAILNFVNGSGSIISIFNQLIYLLVYSLLGASISITYHLSKRNIFVTIIVHIINNAYAVISSLIILNR